MALFKGGTMRSIAILLSATLAACATPQLPDTPVGNYPIGPVNATPQQGETYRCRAGDTEIIVRGVKNPDPQQCRAIERI
jgi:hypothetical protein